MKADNNTLTPVMGSAPFALHPQTIAAADGMTRTLYSYTLNPESGVPRHWCGQRKTTGCPTRAAAERFVRQRIAELKRGPPPTTPLVECSHLLGAPDRLRAAAEERGYLFFRGLLPADAVVEVRRDVARVLRRHGALADGTADHAAVAREGVVLEGSSPTEQYRRYYNAVLGLRSLNALPHHPLLMGIIEQLCGQEILLHPRHVCHAIFPGLQAFKTPPHQDHFSVRGTPHTWTVWLPLGDCDEPLGGIMIAEGSHKAGLLEVVEDTIWVDPGADRRWAWSPMATGDVLVFHSLAVHQGRDNTSSDRIRLAGSFRYQPAREPVDEAALKPQHGYTDWEELYADWPRDDPLKYYWQAPPLDVQAAPPHPASGRRNA